MTSDQYGFIIVGVGIAGCLLASRLHEKYLDGKILLIEAGQDVTNHPLVINAASVPTLQHSDLNWDYNMIQNVPSAAWICGDRHDYDEWGALVNDTRWSYAGILPYFIETETYHIPSASPSEHGFSGPIHTSTWDPSSSPPFPPQELVEKAWQGEGIHEIPDGNAESPLGITGLTKNGRNGRRQLASEFYP